MIQTIRKFRIRSRELNLILLIFIPAAALCCMEFYTHVPWDLSIPVFLLNLGFYYLVYLFCSAVAGSWAGGYRAATLLFMAAGLTNYCVVSFRSSPIVPWDIYSIGTAFSVAGNYRLEITGKLILVLAGFLILAALGGHIGGKFQKRPVRIGGVFLLLLALAGYGKAIQTDQVVEAVGLDTTLFTPNVLYRNNGLVGGFLGNMKYLRVEKPDGYSAGAVEEIAGNYQTEETKENLSEMPNIIVIMNEAFSDLSVFGEFETDKDYLPFIHSLEENTVKGNCYVSVKGGNTANSEYEFLTGDSMLFMPAGSVPYQQYLKKEMPGLASRLADLGYTTAALHPYNASGWCRDTVYPKLGFEETYFKEDFTNPEKIRGYVSDRSAFAKIIDLYEEKEEGERLFAFEVTMQNHGGYSKDKGGFTEQIHVTGLPDKTTQVRALEKYLTLIWESDQAFEELVHYFEGQEENTIILMFGDHQPSDYITNPLLRLLGLNREESEDVFNKNYIVPYVMWANYDLEAEQGRDMSLNYLGGLLMEKAGIGLTGYQQFLKELQKEYPVVTANTVMDQETMNGLEAYHYLVYNHLCDSNHYPELFFE